MMSDGMLATLYVEVKFALGFCDVRDSMHTAEIDNERGREKSRQKCFNPSAMVATMFCLSVLNTLPRSATAWAQRCHSSILASPPTRRTGCVGEVNCSTATDSKSAANEKKWKEKENSLRRGHHELQ